MNRYINRYTLAVILTMLFSGMGYSQIKITGPETVAAGKKIVVKVDPGDALDLKYTVLKDGAPFADYLGFKDLNDDKPILLFTDTETGTYAVLVSGNKDGKTLVLLYSCKVGDPEDKKPKPKPKPTPENPFAADVKRLYDAAEDAATLDNLIQTFTDVKAYLPKLKNYGEFENTIIATANDRIKDTAKLRTVRDRIGDYLLEKTGKDPRKWDATKAGQVCDDVLAALKGCK